MPYQTVSLGEQWGGVNKRVADVTERQSPDCTDCDNLDGKLGTLGPRLGRRKLSLTPYGATVTGLGLLWTPETNQRLLVATADGQVTDEAAPYLGSGAAWSGPTWASAVVSNVVKWTVPSWGPDTLGAAASSPYQTSSGLTINVVGRRSVVAQLPDFKAQVDGTLALEIQFDGGAWLTLAAGRAIWGCGGAEFVPGAPGNAPNYLSGKTLITGLRARITNNGNAGDTLSFGTVDPVAYLYLGPVVLADQQSAP